MRKLTMRDFSEIVLCNRRTMFKPPAKPQWCTWCKRYLSADEGCPIEQLRREAGKATA